MHFSLNCPEAAEFFRCLCRDVIDPGFRSCIHRPCQAGWTGNMGGGQTSREKRFATFGKFAFGFPYSPSSADETPLREFMTKLLDEEPSSDQMSSLRCLFFESHTMALTDVRQRAES